MLCADRPRSASKVRGLVAIFDLLFFPGKLSDVPDSARHQGLPNAPFPAFLGVENPEWKNLEPEVHLRAWKTPKRGLRFRIPTISVRFERGSYQQETMEVAGLQWFAAFRRSLQIR